MLEKTYATVGLDIDVEEKYLHPTKRIDITYDQAFTSSIWKIVVLSILISSGTEETSGSLEAAEGITRRRITSKQETKVGDVRGRVTPPNDKNKVSLFAILLRELHRTVDWTWSELLFVLPFPNFSLFCARRWERARSQWQRSGPAPAASIARYHTA